MDNWLWGESIPIVYRLWPKNTWWSNSQFSCNRNILLWVASSGRQNQNSLVEHAWETATKMARAFITDMQMPKNFWYWAFRQSNQVMNYFPCTVSGVSNIPHELVYGIKPDLCISFCLFSTGYFRKIKDGTHHPILKSYKYLQITN